MYPSARSSRWPSCSSSRLVYSRGIRAGDIPSKNGSGYSRKSMWSTSKPVWSANRPITQAATRSLNRPSRVVLEMTSMSMGLPVDLGGRYP